MLSTTPPDTGRLLISEPFMMDPNFKRSVILITEYAPEGVMGFVLNQESEYQLGDIMPDILYADMPLFKGGPVGNNTLHFIHRCPDKIDGGILIGKGIYWGGDFETVKSLANSSLLSNDEIRFFIGYSGWQEGQLDDEINEGSWMVTNQFDTDILFNHNEETFWKDVVRSLGQRYAHIANFPENPALN